MKKIFGLIAFIVLLVVGIWALWQRLDSSVENDRLQVVSTFYPLGYFAQQVGGGHIQHSIIIPVSVEPHDFTPTPKDIVQITSADLLVYNGAGLDEWASSIPLADFKDGSHTRIEVSALAPAGDPHVWLDAILMQQFVEELGTIYTSLNPVHASDYENNAAAVIKRLQQLDTAYQQGLANCEIRQAIVAHDAFGYIGERYNIELLPIVGLNPNETPSAQTIAELSALAQEHEINYIFFEELTSPKLSEVLASEVGAETLVLSPLEGLSVEDQAAGEDYFTLMEQNLSNLRLALRCQ